MHPATRDGTLAALARCGYFLKMALYAVKIVRNVEGGLLL